MSKIDVNPSTNPMASYAPALAALRAAEPPAAKATRMERRIAQDVVDFLHDAGEEVDSYEIALAAPVAVRETRMQPTRIGTKTHQHVAETPSAIMEKGLRTTQRFADYMKEPPPDGYRIAIALQEAAK